MNRPWMHASKRRLAQYGLDNVDWNKMIDGQGRRCAVCEKTFTRTRPPVIDHDHATGHVRGLLCSPCNYWLGTVREEKIIAAGRYLDRKTRMLQEKSKGGSNG